MKALASDLLSLFQKKVTFQKLKYFFKERMVTQKMVIPKGIQFSYQAVICFKVLHRLQTVIKLG